MFLQAKSLCVSAVRKRVNMEVQRLDHIAIAVPDLEKAVETYQKNFGLAKVREGHVPSLGIRNVFLQIGDAQLELITPLSMQGPVADFLTQQGGGLYLLALEVSELDALVATLRNQGIRVNLAEGSSGQRLAFVSPKATHGVVLQLFERQ